VKKLSVDVLNKLSLVKNKNWKMQFIRHEYRLLFFIYDCVKVLNILINVAHRICHVYTFFLKIIIHMTFNIR